MNLYLFILSLIVVLLKVLVVMNMVLGRICIKVRYNQVNNHKLANTGKTMLLPKWSTESQKIEVPSIVLFILLYDDNYSRINLGVFLKNMLIVLLILFLIIVLLFNLK